MRISIATLLLLGLVAGCGSGNNNGNDGGVGGNGAGDGGGGGGGSGCTDQCAAGATQCADAGDLQTCMPMNGCLQWVTSACGASQICKTGATDLGTGAACVSGVPCTCPSGFSCDATGACVGGDVTKIGIDVKTVNVGGTITLNGGAPTTGPDCNNAPTDAKATVVLYDATRGYEFSLPVACSSDTFAWSGVIFPGTYSIAVEQSQLAGVYSNLPSQPFIAASNVTIGADMQNIKLDVKTVSVSGSVTVGGAAPVPSASCTGTVTAATVHFSDKKDGYAFDLDIPCSSASFAWSGTIFPGTYDVSVTGVDGLSNLPTGSFIYKLGLAVPSNLTNQVIAVTTNNVSGTITLNGVAPTDSSYCTSYPTQTKATVHLADATQGYSFDIAIPCSATTYAWSGVVYPGNYKVSVNGDLTYTNLPPATFVALPSLSVQHDVSNQTLAVTTQTVAGTVTLNGAAPTPASYCTSYPTSTQATVTLVDAAHGYSFSAPIPCSATTLAWSASVFPGTYQVSVAGAGATYSTLPTQAYPAQASLVVNAAVNNIVLDVKTVTASGSITLDGATPTSSTYCTSYPTTAQAIVTLTDATHGYAFSLSVPCSSTTFAWSGTIFPGTYQARVSGVASYSNVPSQSYLALASLAVTSNVNGATLDVQTRNVGGTVTLNGAAPVTSTACNPSPTAAKGQISFVDDSDGYSFTLPIACSAADFSFMGVVYPGTYRISVAGANGYSNLPTDSFLGTPRLVVK